jgi:hypothetical protein
VSLGAQEEIIIDAANNAKKVLARFMYFILLFGLPKAIIIPNKLVHLLLLAISNPKDK